MNLDSCARVYSQVDWINLLIMIELNVKGVNGSQDKCWEISLKKRKVEKVLLKKKKLESLEGQKAIFIKIVKQHFSRSTRIVIHFFLNLKGNDLRENNDW